MGIFDFLKGNSEQPKPSENSVVGIPSLTLFECYYLYGLTDNPFRQSANQQGFGKLYNNVVGSHGAILIGSSFHPYHLVNLKGTTIWHAAYVEVYVNKQRDQAFASIVNDKAVILTNPSGSFNQLHVWPDTRLTFDENPGFSKYVPFVIPFLVYKPADKLIWDQQIETGMKLKGNATEYVSYITQLIRFMMPEPSFILGFDKFDEQNPSKMIDNFIACKGMLGM